MIIYRMEKNCEMISSENVKPSSPTPQHLQTYKLSMLDQIVPSMFVPVVIYFPNTTTSDSHDLFISQTTQSLKDSLSVILTRFYPLAGRIINDKLVGGSSIDCNDHGVPFVVVKFPGSKLSDLLRNPGPDLPRRLVPCEITWDHADEEAESSSCVALIQVSYFDCGGIVIGAVFWHKVADAMAAATFLKSWAAATRGGSKQYIFPNYIAQSIFPHKQQIPSQYGSLAPLLRTGKSVMRRYVFDAPAISTLKSRSGGMDGGYCSRVEIVSALMWKCFMAASLANNKSVSVLTQAVNLRRRAQPPFPSECFGNFPGLAAANCSNKNGNDLGQLVKKMRDAIMKIDNEYINRMKGDEGFSGYHENLGLMWSQVPEDADLLCISSWCNFGLYNIDFGWGKPGWLSRCDTGSDPKSQFLNMVWLMDTRVGDGIEAWVILDEKYMSVFHNVDYITSLASIN